MPQPGSWYRVVKAAETITWPTKGVWDEIRLLDQGRGCWATSKSLGSRLALAARTVEGMREWLKWHEMLDSERKGAVIYWFVRLPSDCYPPSVRPTDAAVLALAQQLDHHIRQREADHAARTPAKRPTREPELRGGEPAQLGTILKLPTPAATFDQPIASIRDS